MGLPAPHLLSFLPGFVINATITFAAAVGLGLLWLSTSSTTLASVPASGDSDHAWGERAEAVSSGSEAAAAAAAAAQRSRHKKKSTSSPTSTSRTVDIGSDHDICAVCLIEVPKRPCRLDPCAHVFCAKCVARLLRRHLDSLGPFRPAPCPLCRAAALRLALVNLDPDLEGRGRPELETRSLPVEFGEYAEKLASWSPPDMIQGQQHQQWQEIRTQAAIVAAGLAAGRGFHPGPSGTRSFPTTPGPINSTAAETYVRSARAARAARAREIELNAALRFLADSDERALALQGPGGAFQIWLGSGSTPT